MNEFVFFVARSPRESRLRRILSDVRVARHLELQPVMRNATAL
jgi:hypothetical protein